MAIQDDWRESEYPASDPRAAEPLILAPSQQRKRAEKRDIAKFSFYFALVIACFIPLLQQNGIDVNWKVSLLVYIILIAFSLQTYYLHYHQKHRGWRGHIGAMIIILLLGGLSSVGVKKQYAHDHMKPIGPNSSSKAERIRVS